MCKRCLLADIGEIEYAAHIGRYIDALGDSEKVGAGLYLERLAFCRGCDGLVNGVCRFCGCFVELRAVRVGVGCPNPGFDKWACLIGVDAL